MKRKFKIATIITSLFMACLFINVNVEAAQKTIGSFCYTYQEISWDSIWITGIDIKKEKDISTLQVPSKIEGKKVAKIGRTTDEENDFVSGDNIFGIYRSEDDEKLKPKQIIKKVAKIQKIVLPETLTDMTPNCFLHLQDGKSIYIPKGLTKNILFLCEIKWKNFDISTQNEKYKVKNSMILSKGGKKTYGFVGSGNQAIIPQGVKTLGERTFYGTGVTSIRIPKSVNKIERDVFSYLKAVQFQIDKANKNYGVTRGCLYSKRSGRLVAGVAKAGIVKVPKGVTCVNEETVILGKDISKIVFPKSMKTIGRGWDNSLLNEEAFRGNTLELTFKGKKPPVVDTSVFFTYRSISKVKILVPKGTKTAYKSAFQNTIDKNPFSDSVKVTVEES